MPRKKKETKESEGKKVDKKETKEKKESHKETKKPESIQPEINIGLVGHVDHGKTTLTERLSGKWTDTHSEEIKRGITIRLGYANSSFYKCTKCHKFGVSETCSCGGKTDFVRKVSFVDAPGHESLMVTMLSGAAIMDAALVLVAANEECPQPQTMEHIMALEIVGIKNVIIIQNKIDLVSEQEAIKNYEQIKEFLKNTSYKDAPIIPISAQFKINMDVLIEAMQQYFPTPQRNPNLEPIMLIARSFDVNKPGTDIPKLIGGVLGGSLKQGIFKLNDEIEIRPGHVVEEANKKVAKPIKTKIVGLMTGTDKVDEVQPGGSVALLTQLDPSIVKSDSLTGNVVSLPGKGYPVLYQMTLKVHLLERVVGIKKELTVEPIKMGEILMLNINSAATVGIVYELGKNLIKCNLKLPVCAEKGQKVTISRRVEQRFRLIGYGIIE